MSIALDELQHSVKLHIALKGVSPQLAMYLMKVIDFIEDEDVARRETEMINLAFHMVESLALFVQEYVDEKRERAEHDRGVDAKFPVCITQSANNLLITLGRARNHENKIEAKNAVLRAISVTLKELAAFTKAKYPPIVDSQNQLL